MEEVEVGASRKVFDLRLGDLGPYNIDFSRSGRYMLIGGKKGHLGLMDWQAGRTFCEVQVSQRSHLQTCMLIRQQSLYQFEVTASISPCDRDQGAYLPCSDWYCVLAVLLWCACWWILALKI